ncbi:hypothetical protein J2S00_002729 [Caldalkalibacillus uzonensis]|uniref:Uncharacterized protein n=1 Tax=Caldalkalibacillus uzonensis TaxID=353224 RepID=A0ABU0CVM9_9BACI|nr:hypothetical protein [Caldalkalibacillus uzonensis]MDQ0339934.1 hypothetical protein [Caldalkalibacillus uzonensis]
MTHSGSDLARRVTLPEGLVAEVYAFSDYISCINVYKQGVCIKIFCSDRSSIEEWLEEPGMIMSMVK